MMDSAGSTAHLQHGMTSDAAAADAAAMWQLSNHLNSLQLQQTPLPGRLLHVLSYRHEAKAVCICVQGSGCGGLAWNLEYVFASLT